MGATQPSHTEVDTYFLAATEGMSVLMVPVAPPESVLRVEQDSRISSSAPWTCRNCLQKIFLGGTKIIFPLKNRLQFNYLFEYIKGEDNVNSDCLIATQ